MFKEIKHYFTYNILYRIKNLFYIRLMFYITFYKMRNIYWYLNCIKSENNYHQ